MRGALIQRQSVMMVTRFRTVFEEQGYACLDADGSLKPVPPGKTQEELYCADCQAEKCLWKSRGGESKKKRRKRKPRKDSRAQMARYRARGLNAIGNPLTPSCWNCVHLRQVGLKQEFVCKFAPEDLPVNMRTLTLRTVKKTGCKRFGMRLVMEIPRSFDGAQDRLATLARNDGGDAALARSDEEDEGWGEEDYCPRCGAEVTGQRRCYECGWDMVLGGIEDGLSSEF